VAIGSMGLASIYSFLLLVNVCTDVGHGFHPYSASITWLPGGTAGIEIGVMVDQLTAAMLFMVSFVGFWIFVYSRDYMGQDPRFSQFFSYLSLFAFSMLGLVVANNFLLLFIGWELVGLCSYLLIGFWFEKTSAADAAKKAFITTKIGDLGFSLALMLILWATAQYGPKMTFNFYNNGFGILEKGLLAELPVWLATAIALLIFMGAMGKSAQFPLHVWLPDAMEGPTSVSALIHAATMVAAGVYLVGRAYPIFVAAVVPLMIVAMIGAFTAVFAATIAVAANDIKRVLAYSTLSQLGYMMLGLGVGGYTAALFHLLTHAFFKALLFLGSGSVIHGMHGEQDIRKMGNLRKYMPWTFVTFLIGTLALVGFPLTSGFFSKDEIIASAALFAKANGHISLLAYLPLLMGLAGVFLTAFYMTRCVVLTFFGDKVRSEVHPHESSSWMIAPLVVLAVFALLGGFLGIPGEHNLFHGFVHFDWHPWEYLQAPDMLFIYGTHEEGVNWLLMFISVVLGFGGIGAGYVLYGMKVIDLEKVGKFPLMKALHIVVSNKYFVDEIYRYCVICVHLMIAKLCFVIDHFIVDKFVDFWAWIMEIISRRVVRPADDKVVDRIAVDGWGYISLLCSRKLVTLQTGYVQTYIMVFCIGIILLAILGAIKFY